MARTGASGDTPAEVEEVQLDLLRQAGAAGRARLMRSLSRTVIGASRRELARQLPDADEVEVGIWWVELNYGAELARGLRARLGRHRR